MPTPVLIVKFASTIRPSVVQGRLRFALARVWGGSSGYTTIPMPPLLVIAAAVASGLAVYLVVAMLAPERFS